MIWSSVFYVGFRSVIEEMQLDPSALGIVWCTVRSPHGPRAPPTRSRSEHPAQATGAWTARAPIGAGLPARRLGEANTEPRARERSDSTRKGLPHNAAKALADGDRGFMIRSRDRMGIIDDDILGELGGLVAAKSRGLVKLRSPQTSPSFRVFRCAGRAGVTTTCIERVQHTFKPRELFATDTSTRPGYGVGIGMIFSGADNTWKNVVSPTGGVPTWMFGEYVLPEQRSCLERLAAQMGTSEEDDFARLAAARLRYANAAARFPWGLWYAGLDIIINLHFEADCTWQAVFWGDEIG